MSPHVFVVFAALVGSAAALSIQGSARPTIFQGRCASPKLAELPGALSPDTWSIAPSVKVQGDTLKTWEVKEEETTRVQLGVRSEGRPVNANIELWHTPSYIPTKFRIYTEDGLLRPVNAVIETPKHPKTVAVYNTGTVDFPFDATVANTGLGSAYDSLSSVEPELVQGGRITSYAAAIKQDSPKSLWTSLPLQAVRLRTPLPPQAVRARSSPDRYTFGAEVDSVQVLLKTEERNMKAMIELTQVKQIIELYASVGYKNPFYAVIQTPGTNNAIRIINQNTVEFPFNAYVVPYELGAESRLSKA